MSNFICASILLLNCNWPLNESKRKIETVPHLWWRAGVTKTYLEALSLVGG